MLPAAPTLGGIDHLEWWVGNARAFTGFLAAAFGFDVVAYAGPETGRRDRVSYLLQQGRVRFMVSGALHPDSPIAEHVRQHGDGIRDICFLVDDVAAAYDGGPGPGRHALSGRRPTTRDAHGAIHHAAIRTYGDTVHTFLDRSAYTGPFAPQFEPTDLLRPVGPGGGHHPARPRGRQRRAGPPRGVGGYYEDVLGFDQLTHFSDDQISTEYSALMSTVVWNHDKVVLPDQRAGRRAASKSQIEEYLDFYGAPGVQHIALHTPDIVQSVRALRAAACASWTCPAEYYDEARQRLDGRRAALGRPSPSSASSSTATTTGYLLQIFTETLTDRPTVFFEIIQREGARGFGEGNFKALFESIERAQARRGNL